MCGTEMAKYLEVQWLGFDSFNLVPQENCRLTCLDGIGKYLKLKTQVTNGVLYQPIGSNDSKYEKNKWPAEIPL